MGDPTCEVDNPLVVMSYRLPFEYRRNGSGILERKTRRGSFGTTVAPAIFARKAVWIGWPGYLLSEEIPKSYPKDNTPTAILVSNRIVPVDFDPETFDKFYNGCCNQSFWPILHSMTEKALFSAEEWKAYSKFNQAFADRAVDVLKHLEHDSSAVPLIWIHDYHLMLSANKIRREAEEKRLPCKMGFFLHVPFPSWDIFKVLPWHDEVLRGMLGCDMVGFHIKNDCHNFIDCCERKLGCSVDRENLHIEHDGRKIKVRAIPLGIAFHHFDRLAKTTPSELPETQQKVILGVERLDYTKGLVHRLKAFELLLEVHPEHRECITFLQISVPSRTKVKSYTKLKKEMDQLVGHINSRFATRNWSPIRYIYRSIEQEELAAIYRDADVALVTPLRDGMNMVAKEFVACRVKDPGVLILSKFAGAAETMKEALTVNPYRIDEVASAIHCALTMPEDERQDRMNHLRQRLQLNDVNHWINSFFKFMGTINNGEEAI